MNEQGNEKYFWLFSLFWIMGYVALFFLGTVSSFEAQRTAMLWIGKFLGKGLGLIILIRLFDELTEGNYFEIIMEDPRGASYVLSAFILGMCLTG
jgi:hypothetical protein